ncbi:uncharacterized protein LOC117168500 [Belonocnema kinseyi]|uniref:uncharacterized protein LOC117168500 n=1 Tax=Belonocnema kinseyi TaxID=2817044 RepID=UPI00143D4DDB|nr:uncharacterized protein LOC117168500 [Belonocnema kinseyi]
MSVPFSGCKSRSNGLISAIIKQLKTINYKPAKKITVQFDPFHERATEMRKLMFYLTGPKYANTNPACLLKTNIVCDRSEPLVTVDLVSGEKVVMKCNNLTLVEVLQLYNKHVTSLVPREQEKDEDLKSKLKSKKGKKR